MISLPEIAIQLIDKTLTNISEDNVRTVFLVGSKSVGKSTLLYAFLDKNDAPRETLVIEYFFGRKSFQKQGIDKTLCHIWEYGGKLATLPQVLSSIPVRGKYFFCVMVDLSKIKCIWETLETCVQTMQDTYAGRGIEPELIIIGGKYDVFKNFETETKKFITTSIRSFALYHNAHVLFYSSKEPQLARRVKDMLQSIGFGNCIPVKEKNTNFTKPLSIPKGSDSWESIGIAHTTTLEQLKMRHLSRIPSSSNIDDSSTAPHTQLHSQPEPAIDSLVKQKYRELSSMASFDGSIDYLRNYQ